MGSLPAQHLERPCFVRRCSVAVGMHETLRKRSARVSAIRGDAMRLSNALQRKQAHCRLVLILSAVLGSHSYTTRSAEYERRWGPTKEFNIAHSS